MTILAILVVKNKTTRFRILLLLLYTYVVYRLVFCRRRTRPRSFILFSVYIFLFSPLYLFLRLSKGGRVRPRTDTTQKDPKFSARAAVFAGRPDNDDDDTGARRAAIA